MVARAAASREAIDRDADPELVLSLVVWPTEPIVAARNAGGRGPVGR
jgi:hypothetical protein